MASFDTTRRLVGALDAARTFRRQSAGLLALLLACAAWILSSADTPEPFAGLLIAVAACALVIELGLALAARRREAACADELILSGFGASRHGRRSSAPSPAAPPGSSGPAHGIGWRSTCAGG